MPKPALRLARAAALIFALSVTGYLAFRAQRESAPRPPAAEEQAVEIPAADEATNHPPSDVGEDQRVNGPGGAINPAGTMAPNTTFISTSKSLKLNLPTPPSLSKEELDAALDDYFLRSSKSAPINLVPEPEEPESSDPSVDQ